MRCWHEHSVLNRISDLKVPCINSKAALVESRHRRYGVDVSELWRRAAAPAGQPIYYRRQTDTQVPPDRGRPPLSRRLKLLMRAVSATDSTSVDYIALLVLTSM